MASKTNLHLLESLSTQQEPFAFYYFKPHGGRQAAGLLLHDLKQQFQIDNHDTLERMLKQVPRHLNQGYSLAGALHYEAGYGFEKKMQALTPSPALLGWLGFFKQAVTYSPALMKTWLKRHRQNHQHWPAYWLRRVETDMTFTQYRRQFRRIQTAIAAGRTYQVNFTFPLQGHFGGDAVALFHDLFHAQPVGYAAILRRKEDWILSLSPELFFSKQGDEIMVKPMKGTAARSSDPATDRLRETKLASSFKNRAENIMIVDLLRNDLGRLCRTGSVRTRKLFQVESYRTLFQMTSTVEGKLRAGVSWLELFRALFPCGSVTGAPKVETMKLIRAMEQKPRGIYTGALGYILPNGDACFNVPIRTVQLNPQDKHLTCGIGSGIVSDSKAKAEWQECHVKSRFLTGLGKNYELIETMFGHPERGIRHLDRHLERLRQSAAYFHIPFQEQVLQRQLLAMIRRLDASQPHRLRLLLNSAGQITLSSLPLAPEVLPGRIQLAKEQVTSSHLFLYHKTTNRDFYNRYTQKARVRSLTDYVFCNKQGKVTEGSITNIFVVKNNIWFTPPVRDGLLPGVMRQVVIAQQHAREKSLTVRDLLSADQLYLTNAVRGLIKVSLYHPGRPVIKA